MPARDAAQQHEHRRQPDRLRRAVGHAENRQGAQHGTAEDQRFIAPGHRGHAPGKVGAHRQAHRQWQQVQRGAVGAGTGHGLKAQRHQHRQGNRLETGEKHRTPAQHRAAVGEQVHRQQRFPRTPLMPDKYAQRHQRAGQQR